MSDSDVDLESLALRVQNLEFEMPSSRMYLWIHSTQILFTGSGAATLIGALATYSISGINAAITFAEQMIQFTVAVVMLVSVVIWISTSISGLLLTR
jgi:hypothetical protein